MKQQHDGFDTVLIAPTEKVLGDTLTNAVQVANARCRTGLVELRTATASDIWRRLAERPEGFWQRLGGGPRHKEAESGLAVAWWSDPLGRRHVRVRSVRWQIGSDEPARANILAPFAGSRPSAWLVYPDYLYLVGEAEQFLAVCPCGVVGTLDAIGWMGDRCAACHDRGQDGVNIAGRERAVPWTFAQHSVVAVAFAPDGRTLAACTQNSGPQVRDLATGEVREWHGTLPIHPDADLAFLPDGDLVWGQSKVVAAFAPHTLNQRRLIATGHAFDRITLSPDGSLLVTRSRDLHVWHVPTGERRFSLTVASGDPVPHCAAFYPDGQSLAVGMSNATIRWWRTAQGREDATWPVPGPPDRRVMELAIAPDGRHLASISDGDAANLHLWDVATGKVRATWSLNRTGYQPRSGMRQLAFAPDGRTLVVRDTGGVLKCFDVEAGDSPLSLVSAGKPEIQTTAFSPDGCWLAVGCDRGLVKLWPWEPLVAAARRLVVARN